MCFKVDNFGENEDFRAYVTSICRPTCVRRGSRTCGLPNSSGFQIFPFNLKKCPLTCGMLGWWRATAHAQSSKWGAHAPCGSHQSRGFSSTSGGSNQTLPMKQELVQTQCHLSSLLVIIRPTCSVKHERSVTLLSLHHSKVCQIEVTWCVSAPCFCVLLT